MLNAKYILELYNNGNLEGFTNEILYLAAKELKREEFKKGILLEKETARIHIENALVIPYRDIDLCLDLISKSLNAPKTNLYQKSLYIKKRKYFKSLKNLQISKNIYSIIVSINWYAMNMSESEKWNEFIFFMTGEGLQTPPKNTRPASGYKTYMISSKIIYNRNGGN